MSTNRCQNAINSTIEIPKFFKIKQVDEPHQEGNNTDLERANRVVANRTRAQQGHQ
jgi:hypothetical protein